MGAINSSLAETASQGLHDARKGWSSSAWSLGTILSLSCKPQVSLHHLTMPGFMEDPLTGDFPSRNELEEEEEAALASDLPQQYTVKPTVDVSNVELFHRCATVT